MLSVILDIDQTLVLTTEYPLSSDAILIKLKKNNLFVHKRPWVDSFLLELQSLFIVGIWTAGTEEYAEKLLEVFPNFNPCFVFTRCQCISYNKTYAKNLRGFQTPVVLIDDDAIHAHFNLENKSIGCIVKCTPYETTSFYDQDLLSVLKFLKQNVSALCQTWHEQRLWIIRI